MARPKNEMLPTMLVGAARKLITKRGGPHFSLRELANDVGYTMSAVYRCFDSRDALLLAVQHSLFTEFNQHCMPRLDLSPAQAVHDIGRRYLEWAVEHPAYYGFMFDSDVTFDNEAERREAQMGLHALTLMLRVAIPERADAVDPADLAVVLLATIHGLASLAIKQRLVGTHAEDIVAFYDGGLAKIVIGMGLLVDANKSS